MVRVGLGLLLGWLLVGWGAGCKSPARTPGGALNEAVKATPAGDYWLNAIEEVYKSPLELRAQHEAEQAKNIHLRKLMRGNPKEMHLALTFDDGPHPNCTPALLKVLDALQVKATFFVVGEKAEQAPNLVKAEIAAGHSVGNHTYHHVNLCRIPDRLVAAEIEACGEVIQHLTGQQPTLFRPPGGDYDLLVGATANQLGYTMILWTDDPADYARPPDQVIMDRTLHTAHNGGIILLHDGVMQTVQVLPQIVHDLRARGFTFVTVEDMLREPGHE